MEAQNLIHDRGRGPELVGTRITVFALFDCVEAGWSTERIADLYSITGEQVEAAAAYIEANRDYVVTEPVRIKARHAKGNPPHIQAVLDENHRKFLQRLTPAQREHLEGPARARSAG